MSVTSELYTLNNYPNNNTRWMRISDPNYHSQKLFDNNRVTLNTEMTFSSMNRFLTFYNIFIIIPIYREFEPKTLDQGYLNYLYYRGVFQAAGLNLSVTHPGEYLISVHGGQFHPQPNSDSLRHAGDAGHSRCHPSVQLHLPASPRTPLDLRKSLVRQDALTRAQGLIPGLFVHLHGQGPWDGHNRSRQENRPEDPLRSTGTLNAPGRQEAE
jgi:hypothetical protein